jgi:hypothetical protein
MDDSLNDLVLSDQLIAALYAHVLVEPQALPGGTKATLSPPAVLKFLGKNDRHVIILVAHDQHTFLPEEELAFLTRILQACQMNIADAAIVNTAKQPEWYNSLNQLTPQKIISFGVQHPSKDLSLFSSENVDNILWLTAPPLFEFIRDTEQSKVLKTKLWSCLKDVFQIK